jgi:APA family basic amino acid/polyamine antiporter
LATKTQTREVAQDTEMVKGIGLTTATTLVMGSMIGSGVFIVAADIARLTGSPALLIAAWLVTGFMTVSAALAYGELAAMMPKAGGQYVYLRESLGPLWGFLYGWTFFLVIQTGTIAAVGVAFGKFLGHFFPSVSSSHWLLGLHWHAPKVVIGPVELGGMDVGLNTANLAGIVIIILLTIVNVFGVRTGAIVQNIFTFAKTAALLGLVLLGVFIGGNAEALAANFTAEGFWKNFSWHASFPVAVGSSGAVAFVGILTVIAVAQVGSLFSADAWNSVTFTAGEMKNPKRNLPISLAVGTGVVIFLYIAVNYVYLRVLPLTAIQHAAEDRVGTAAMVAMLGALGGSLMAGAILISTFGCNNGLILSGARVYYAMAKDGLFFRKVGTLHPKYKTPAFSLAVQAVWTCLLCLSGTYGQLLDYIIFAVLVFYILTIAGLFVLRVKRPDADRPYKAFGYPVLPAIYIAMALFIDVVLLLYKPQYTWPGLAIVLLGIPVYFLWSRRSSAPAAARA